MGPPAPHPSPASARGPQHLLRGAVAVPGPPVPGHLLRRGRLPHLHLRREALRPARRLQLHPVEGVAEAPTAPPGSQPQWEAPGLTLTGHRGAPRPRDKLLGVTAGVEAPESLRPVGAPRAQGPCPRTLSPPPWLALEMCGQRPRRAGRAAEVRPDGHRELPQNCDTELERREHGEHPAPSPAMGVGPGAWGAASNSLPEPCGPGAAAPRLP